MLGTVIIWCAITSLATAHPFADDTPPIIDNITVSDTLWIPNNSNTYDLTVRTRQSESGFSGVATEIGALLYRDVQGQDNRGYLSWTPVSYAWTGDQIACRGSGFASKNQQGYGSEYLDLVGCSVGQLGNRVTVVFTLRPHADFGELLGMDVAAKAVDDEGNDSGWQEAAAATFDSDGVAPDQDDLTISSALWQPNDSNTYDITLTATDQGTGVGELRVLINRQGDNSNQKRGLFAWSEPDYAWAEADRADAMPCLDAAGNPDGYAAKYVGTVGFGYGYQYTTLVGCATTRQGHERIVTLSVRPEINFGDIAENDISLWARDQALNTTGWVNYDLNFASVMADNLLLNAGFEDGTTAPFNGGAVKGTISVDTAPENVRTGQYALRQEASEEGSYTGPWYGSNILGYPTQDTTFRFSGWVRADQETDVRLFLFSLDENQVASSEYWSASNYTIGTTWQKVEHTLVCPAGRRYVSVRLDNRQAGHVVWWDDLKLTTVDNLIDNPTFESGTLQLPFTGAVRGTIEIDGTEAWKGLYSLKHTATDADSYTLPYELSASASLMALGGRETFTFSAWAKAAANEPVQLNIFCLDEGFQPLANGSSQSTFTATTSWQRFQHTQTCPDGTSHVSVRLDNDGGAGSLVWWDDLILEPKNVDLTIQDTVLGVPAVVTPGDRLQIDWRVVNQGLDPSALARGRVYLSKSDGSGGIIAPLPPPPSIAATQSPAQLLTEEDLSYMVNGLILEEGEIPELAANGWQEFNLDLEIPITSDDGDWFLLFVCDATSKLQETDETNNVTAIPLTLKGGEEARAARSATFVTISFEGIDYQIPGMPGALEGPIPEDAYGDDGVEMVGIGALRASDRGGTGVFCRADNGSDTAAHAPGAADFEPLHTVINVPNGFTSVYMRYAQAMYNDWGLDEGGFEIWSDVDGTGTMLRRYVNTPDEENGQVNTSNRCWYTAWRSTGTLNYSGKSIKFFENDTSDGAFFFIDDVEFRVNPPNEIEVHDDPIEPREGETEGFTFGITLANPIPYGLDLIDPDHPVFSPRSVEITLERVSAATEGEDMQVLGEETLTFDSTNWNEQQSFTIEAPENGLDNNNQDITFRLSKSGGTSVMLVEEQDLHAIEQDDDFLLRLQTSSGGGLITQPSLGPAPGPYFIDINDYNWAALELTAVPTEGFNFAGFDIIWFGDGLLEVFPGNPTHISQLELNSDGDSEFTITATFTNIPTVTVSMEHNGEGTTTVGGQPVGDGQSTVVEANQSVSLVATPAAGWFFSGWSSVPAGVIANPASPTTSLTTGEDTTVTATFTPNPVTLTIQNNGHGTTSPTMTTVNPGSTVVVTVIPNNGYTFPATITEGWTILSGIVSIDNFGSEGNQFVVTVSTTATIRANFVPQSEGTLLIRAVNLNNPSEVLDLRPPDGSSIQELAFLKEQGGAPHQFELQFFREGDLDLTIESASLQEGTDFCLRATSQLDPPPLDCPLEQSVSSLPLPTLAEGNPPRLYLDFGSAPDFADIPNPHDEDMYLDTLLVLEGNPPFQAFFNTRGTVLGSTDVDNVRVDYLPNEDPPFDLPEEIANGGSWSFDTVDAGVAQTYAFRICNTDTEAPFFADKTILNSNNGGLNTNSFGFFFTSGERLTVPAADSNGESCVNFQLMLTSMTGQDVTYEAEIRLGTGTNLYIIHVSAQADASTIVRITAEILNPDGSFGRSAEIANNGNYPVNPDAPEEGMIYKFYVYNPSQTNSVDLSNLSLGGLLPDDEFRLVPEQSTLPGRIGPNSEKYFSVSLMGATNILSYSSEVAFNYRRSPDGPLKSFKFRISGTIGDAWLDIDLDDIFIIPDPPPGISNLEHFNLPGLVSDEEASFTVVIANTGNGGALNVNIDPDIGTGYSADKTFLSVPANGGTGSFQVSFSSASSGAFPGTVRLLSNDPVAPAFLFTVLTAVEGLAPPSNLLGLALTGARVELDWNPSPASNLLGYKVYRALGNGAMSLLATVSPGNTAYSDTSVAPSTTYAYEVTAYNASDESNPTNRVTLVTPTLPDLRVLNPGWYLSIFPSRYGFFGDLTNTGSGPTDANIKVNWYYSTNQTWSANDILLDTETESPLNGGGSTYTVGFFDFADNNFGPGYILMVADPDASIAESNETNNVTVVPNFSIPTFDGADLIVQTAASHRYVQPGGTVTLFAEIKNIGNDPSVGTSKLGIYIADNNLFDPPPPPSERTLLKTVSVGALNANELVRLDPIQVTVPAGTPPGQYELGYVADHDGQVPESDENNNLLRLTLFVQNKPDPPANLHATDTLDNRIEVSWDAVADADQYLLWRNTVNNPNTAVLAQTSLGTMYYFYTGSFAHARPDTTYYFWVQGENETGIGALSPVETGYIPDVHDPLMWIDAPAANTTQSGTIQVKGWALDATLLDAGNLAFTIDGGALNLANFVYGTGRGDVCSGHPDEDSPNCPNVGWKGDLNTWSLANGPHELKLTVTDDSGNQDLRLRSFTVFNDPASDVTPPTAPGPTTSPDCVYWEGNTCFVNDADFTIRATPSTDGESGVNANGYQICRSGDTTGWGGCSSNLSLTGTTSFLVTGDDRPDPGKRRAYYFRGRDNAGNQSDWNDEIYIQTISP